MLPLSAKDSLVSTHRFPFRLRMWAVSQRSGAPGRLQAFGPPGISSRNSLPALNAMPGVQVLRPVQCVRSRRAFVCRRLSQGHPPGPPQFAGQGLSRRTGHPSTRCCFGGSGSARGMPRVIATLFPARRFSGRGNDALCRLWGGQAERGTFRLTARGLPPQCERVLPDPLTQADSVPACAGPSCQRKDFKTRGR